MIKASKLSGIICEARSPVVPTGEFKLSVDPAAIDPKFNLTLKTTAQLPIASSPDGIIQGPGEYEVAGIKIRGINLEKESDTKHLRTIYSVRMDELQLCFLGPVGKDFDEDFLEKIGEVDVVFINGEADTRIVRLIKDIDPRMVVCRSDKDAKLLAKELGQAVEALDKASVKKKDLDEEEIKLVWLKEKEK